MLLSESVVRTIYTPLNLEKIDVDPTTQAGISAIYYYNIRCHSVELTAKAFSLTQEEVLKILHGKRRKDRLRRAQEKEESDEALRMGRD